MVRALLAGRKTQTRRVPAERYAKWKAGDRLWVRKAWRTTIELDHETPAQFVGGYGGVQFEADGAQVDWDGVDRPGRLRAGMHMPRALSRLTLFVHEVRVQRLQDISEEDAVAEGLESAIVECEGGIKRRPSSGQHTPARSLR